MAQNQMGPVDIGFTNCRKAVADSGGNDSDLATPVNYSSVSALRTRLAAINAGYFTTALLDKLTVNDMVYALRVADDASSIKQ